MFIIDCLSVNDKYVYQHLSNDYWRLKKVFEMSLRLEAIIQTFLTFRWDQMMDLYFLFAYFNNS